MTYAEAIRFLYGLQVFGARPGLDTTRRLAALAGNPQNQLRFIHVAGTNGKGSTCAMLESIYRAAGCRVGLFTSPHLVSFRERIQVNRQLISEADVVRLAGELRASERRSPDRLDANPPQRADLEIGAPTLFEFVTVMALLYFAEQKCDLVIWETGLGGRLDATNIVTPLVSVITNIALDHQAWLGDTLAKIAAEKAGIIKPGVPVVTTERGAEALDVIERIARENEASLTRVESDPFATIHPPASLPGAHQRLNADLAGATVTVLQEIIPVSVEQMAAGLARVQWPGRLQLITRANGQRVLLDGAHNIAGVETLRAALASLLPLPAKRGESWGEGPAETTISSPRPSPLLREEREKPTLILGMLGDKDWRAMCEMLAPLATRILLVPVDSARTARPEELAGACRAVNPRAEVRGVDNLSHALEYASNDAFVVIAGSLYLIGAALALLDPAFSKIADERGLNEWAGGAKTTSPR